MDEIKLRYFISVARHLSFTKAAEDCHVTQSTISKQISALESELGTPLFYRNHHSVVLSAAGARLANDAEDYMEQYRLINDSIRKLHLELDERLTIGVGPLEHALLPTPLSLFAERFPNVEAYCMLYTHKRMVSHFRSGTFDVGICSKLCTNAVTGLKTVPLGTCHWEVCARADSPFWRMPPADQAALKGQIVITLYENEYEPVRPYCIKNNLRHTAFTYSNQVATQLSMVRAGMGVALLPGFLRKMTAPDLRMEDVLGRPLAVEFVAAYNPNAHRPAAEDFLAICRECYAGQPLELLASYTAD